MSRKGEKGARQIGNTDIWVTDVTEKADSGEYMDAFNDAQTRAQAYIDSAVLDPDETAMLRKKYGSIEQALKAITIDYAEARNIPSSAIPSMWQDSRKAQIRMDAIDKQSPKGMKLDYT